MITFKMIVDLVDDARNDPDNWDGKGNVNWNFVEADVAMAFNEAGEPLPEDWMFVYKQAVEAALEKEHKRTQENFRRDEEYSEAQNRLYSMENSSDWP